MDLSFSGAGFMGCYYFGVVNCWNKYIPRDRVRRVAGASAGSLIAAYYLMDLPLEGCLHEIIEMTETVRSKPLGVFDRSNQIVDVLPRSLDKLFPEDAHKRVNGRLHVSMTRLKDFKSVVVNEFETRQDLIDALNCSCFIPVWSGNHTSTYKGVKYIDGGFTNNMPVFDEHTIRVSCFSGASDIAPYDRARMEMMKTTLQGMSLNLSWKNLRRIGRALWPPPASFIAGTLEQGFHDTKEFILSNDLIQCDRCFRATKSEMQPIYSCITPTISPAASPNVSRAPSISHLNAGDTLRADSAGRGSFKLQSTNKRASGYKRRSKGDENWQPAELPPVPIKEHRRKSIRCYFETDRDKSGKKIAREALERLRLEADEAEAEAERHHHDQLHKQQSFIATKTSFAGKLREKLQLIASKSAASDEQNRPAVEMPKILVEEPALVESETRPATVRGEAMAPIQEEKLMSMKSQETAAAMDGRDLDVGRKLRTSSASSYASNDSAIALEAPSPTGVMSSSPAEKYLAGCKQRAQSISLAAVSDLLSAQPPVDRFSLAPSPLPSCPPSPNLNRHCSECIKLRQQARMDALDESVRRAVDHYKRMKSKEPEREFNSIKWKLASWLRQIVMTKYSYSFRDELGHEGAAATAATTAEDDDDWGETMAERKAKRKASHPLAWPPNEIEAQSR